MVFCTEEAMVVPAVIARRTDQVIPSTWTAKEDHTVDPRHIVA